MIGKVIEGRFTGAILNKLPDKNILYIQTEDGTKIALSKSNAISIDDVTDQYPSYGRKILMVMWNNFEVSIIRIGSNMQQSKKQKEKQQNQTMFAEQPTPKRTVRRFVGKNIFIPILCCITIIVVIVGVILCVKLSGKNDVALSTKNNGNNIAVSTVAPTTEPPKRTKDDAILEAQTAAIKKASNELKKKLKNPSSLVINDAKFYYPDYDEENMVMNYAAVKLDYNATNSYGGSVRDTYTYFLVDIETLSAEQVVHIGMN